MVGYKSPKRYILTPRRKKFGKAVARGFNSSLVGECLKQARTRKYLFQKLVHMIQQDMKQLCSRMANSMLQNKSSNALKEFSWNNLIKELAQHAPALLHVLKG